MKKLLFTAFLVFNSTAFASLSDFTPKSLIFLVSLNEIGWKKNSLIKEKIYPHFASLKKVQFANSQGHFLVKDMSLCLRLLAVVAKRDVAPYDLLVRIDLNSEMTSQQLEALVHTKSFLKTYAKEVLLFTSQNFQFHKVGGSESSDVAMAFINRWPSNLSRADAQSYWVNHHGPLVMEVGLPPVVKSYTQIHFNRESATVFDSKFQGLSFETITGQNEFVMFFLRNSSVRKLNEILLKDEENFTPPPLFFAFRHQTF